MRIVQKLYANTGITDKSIICLSNLLVLDVAHNDNVTDDSVQHLINLQELVAISASGITDKSIKKLKKLRVLNVYDNDGITDESIAMLIDLQILNAGCDRKISKITDLSVTIRI
jgi:hypothetical protein